MAKKITKKMTLNESLRQMAAVDQHIGTWKKDVSPEILITPEDARAVLQKDNGESVVLREAYVKGEVVYIPLWYPNHSKEKIIQVDLVDVRAADDIQISYDYVRDGWVIKQASVFEWDDDTPDEDWCDSKWIEVSFIKAWSQDKRNDK